MDLRSNDFDMQYNVFYFECVLVLTQVYPILHSVQKKRECALICNVQVHNSLLPQLPFYDFLRILFFPVCIFHYNIQYQTLKHFGVLKYRNFKVNWTRDTYARYRIGMYYNSYWNRSLRIRIFFRILLDSFLEINSRSQC